MTHYIRSSYMYPFFLFYDGLVSLAVARERNQCKVMTDHAEETITLLTKKSEIFPANYLNKVYLLRAERAVTLGNYSEVMELYNKAISLSKKYGFQHEEALAFERAGMFLLQRNDVDEAYQSLLQSYYSYEVWGKLNHITFNHATDRFKLI